MKRYLILFTLVCVTLTACCSCSNSEKISYVEFEDQKFETIYLYSFENAEITQDFQALTKTEEIPEASGYTYSTKKLSVGDTIRVWECFYFKSGQGENEGFGINGAGVNATVSGLLKTYYVTVKEKNDTFMIVYYEVEDSARKIVAEKSNISEITEQKIEVSKDRIIIKYE